MVDKILFSSDSTEWETPDNLFKLLDKEFNFTLDPAATSKNAKCTEFFTIEDNGLVKSWNGHTVFLNPPYGRGNKKRGIPGIEKWVEKAYKESLEGTTVVCLLPVRTCTKWFHDWVVNKSEIRFLKGRLRFKGAKSSAPFPSMICIFRGRCMK